MKLKSYCWLSLWLFFVALFIGLGFWQLQRYYLKKNLIITYETRIQAPFLKIQQLQAPKEKLLYHRLEAVGEIGRKPNLYWQNRYYQDRYGYHVLTPLWVASTQKYLLVDRGFVAQLPTVNQKDSLNGMQAITGIIYYPDKAGFILGSAHSRNAAGQVLVQTLNFSVIAQTLKASVYPFILYIQSPLEADKGYSWPLSAQKIAQNNRQELSFFGTITPPSRHLGYAVQWFAMALVLACLVVIARRPFHRSSAKRQNK